MNENAERWLHFAREDLKAAESVARDKLFNQVCFHAQQCVEKALKAFIAAGGVAPPKTHSIAELLRNLPDSTLPDDLCEVAVEVDVYYIPTRYPDALPGTLPEGLPGKEDADHALQLGRKILRRIESLLKNTEHDVGYSTEGPSSE